MVSPIHAEKQRDFAVGVVRQLRAAGFEAYWAGGCVRDQLMGRLPKDYDVATNATPPQIRELFGRKRTLAIGAAFGVITVLGPPGAGQVEVATFRQDANYSDGRHPDYVTYSTPEEDAARRDFTINGLFFDPLENRVIDFVGGQRDLHAGILRAIGDPIDRFREDKLRMLRAVRFAARFELSLDAATEEAIRRMANEITVVSPERIAAEMQRILVDKHRSTALRLLLGTGLAESVLPEIVPRSEAETGRLEETFATVDQLRNPSFALALAAALFLWTDASGVTEVGERWRLSNADADRAAWLVEHQEQLRHPRALRWSKLQPVLISKGIRELLDLEEAIARARSENTDEIAWCRALLEWPAERLNPPPLLTGDDLKRAGMPPGPVYKIVLERVRDAQLDEEIHSQEESLAMADRIITETQGSIMDKKIKKKIDTVNQRIQKLRQQLAGAKKQHDESSDIATFERQLAEAEAELKKLKESGG